MNSKLTEAFSLSKAISFAVNKHGNQRDKGGNSYILHCLRVMMRLECEDEMVVGVLHDVLEDTDATIDDLVALGCSQTQIMAIDALTKKEGQTSEDYLREVKKSTVARKVKISDIEDNMDIWRMKNRGNLTQKDLDRINKYSDMWTELTGR